MTYANTGKIAALGLCCALLLAACDVFTSADERVARAERLKTEGKYREALIELRIALDEDADHARAQLSLAETSFYLGDIDAAELAARTALAHGAAAGAVAEVRLRLLLARGQYAELLAQLDGHGLPLSPPALDAARVQALGGLDRCAEAQELAAKIRALQPSLASSSVVVAECRARAGDVAGALRELDSAVSAAPGDAAALMARGRLLQLSGQRRAAEASWKDAADRAIGQLTLLQQVTLLTSLGELQIARNDLAGARATLARLIRLAPQGAAGELMSARIQLAAGDAAGAISIARRMIANGAEFAPARRVMASGLLLAGNVEQARSELGWLAQKGGAASTSFSRVAQIIDSLESTPVKTEKHWLAIAAAQVALGEPAAARVAVAEALRIAPNSLSARVRQAELEIGVGNFEAARAIATTVLTDQPGDATAMMVLVDARIALRQHAQAVEDLERLWKRQPSGPLAVALYRVRRSGGMQDQAEPLTRWLERAPSDVVVLGLYADALRLAGETKGSIVNFEKLLETAPDNVPALNNLALLYHAAGDERAVPTARRAAKLAPNAAAVLDTLGWLLVETGAISEGLPLLKKADDAAGAGLPEIRYHHAAALARGGQAEQARQLLQELLARAADFPARADAERLARALP